MENKIRLSLVGILSLLFGFLAGKITTVTEVPELLVREIKPEISILQLQKIEGDQLHVDISGPMRIVWGDRKFIEGDGKYQIPLAQMATPADLQFQKFPYTGNTKTMKFYPSSSYFARGVEVRYRRFFETKQKATDAGFIPSKSVR